MRLAHDSPHRVGLATCPVLRLAGPGPVNMIGVLVWTCTIFDSIAPD